MLAEKTCFKDISILNIHKFDFNKGKKTTGILLMETIVCTKFQLLNMSQPRPAQTQNNTLPKTVFWYPLRANISKIYNNQLEDRRQGIPQRVLFSHLKITPVPFALKKPLIGIIKVPVNKKNPKLYGCFGLYTSL